MTVTAARQPSDPRRAGPARGAGGRTLVAVGLAMAVVLAVTTAGSAVTWLVSHDAAASERLEGLEVARLDLRCPGGVHVLADPSMAPGTAQVSWRERWSFAAPSHAADVVDGRLEVSTRCSRVSVGSAASSEVVLRLAPGTALAVDARLGDVTVRGADDDVTVRTGVGDVDVRASRAADRVVVRTGTGDVDVRLPASESYDVSARSGVGERRVDVEADGDSPHRVDVSSGVGDVAVLPTP